MGCRSSRMTAAANTGPASGPRPASSTPAMRPAGVQSRATCSGIEQLGDRIGGPLGGVLAQLQVLLVKARLQGLAAWRIGQQGLGLAGQGRRRAGVLDQFRHQELTGQDVGQPHPGLQALAFHAPPVQRGHPVGDDHGPLEQRRLQRGGAAGHQRQVAGRQHGMRLALDALDAGAGQQGLEQAVQARHDGQDEAPARPGQQPGGADQRGRDVLDLALAAAGQQRDDGVAVWQLQGRAGGLARRLQRDGIGERVADKGGVDAGSLQDLGLEGEEAEHMVGRGLDLDDALRPPGPDRRADEVHGLDAALAQPVLQAEVEVRCIDADEHIGPPGQQPVAQLLADRQQLAQVQQRVDIAKDRQLAVRPPALEALGDHLRAADALRGHARPARAQALQQQAGQQVAAGLAGHHAEAGRRAHPVSARCRASRRRGRPAWCRCRRPRRRSPRRATRRWRPWPHPA
mmetsp:Transcript_5757/g.14034  ORF Transcript_5757/g.14034 Transcript_5757/m.14034 type:complete len:458 (-) Transcript_5757:1291-2664(-)